jgi:hypothetical protein
MSIHPLHPTEDVLHMTGTTWQHRLDTAGTVSEVVGVARDFLASFDPVQVHALPSACWPPERIIDGHDVSAYAFDLVRHECTAPGAEDLAHRLARFFSHASTRIAQLSSPDVREARDLAQRSA